MLGGPGPAAASDRQDKKMRILRANEMGFCFGVRRAVEMMEEAVRERGEMVSLGSVVHNPQVVERLRGEGLAVITDLSDAGAKPVAITAHGVAMNVIKGIEDAGLEIWTRRARSSRARSSGQRSSRTKATGWWSSATPTTRRCAVYWAGPAARS